MKFKATKDYIEFITDSGFMVFYLWWGIDRWENRRVIQFAIGRPKHNLHFTIPLRKK